MKLPLKFITLFFLLSICKSYSQDYYKIKSYQISNTDKNEMNWPSHYGTLIFRYLRIEPKIDIEYQYQNNKKYIGKWSDYNIVQVVGNQNGEVFYWLVNNKPTNRKDNSEFVLVFDIRYNLTKVIYTVRNKEDEKTYLLYPVKFNF